ncbi:MAG: hypothetical protein CVT64_10355 [Actinobacteria bacterium HGW-Actinobacteria-4]|nr:MAG: hypothetical protein CVT64_10355 [Actinobacteria bacterium HGW-Actinobacteria-4]
MTSPSLSLLRLRLLRAAAVGVGLVALAACSGTDAEPAVTDVAPVAGGGASGDPATPEPVATLTLVDYCVVVAPFLQPVERAYVGSDQHVADIAELKELSEPALAEALELLERHYDEAVDPANPDSQNFPSFPEDVKAAALFVDSELRALCE